MVYSNGHSLSTDVIHTRYGIAGQTQLIAGKPTHQ
ncbi:unnamed protein product [Penicillium camemberti]|uniref:Str. FM013 n=1 Tax=Penicillium camemberti (strain FM 013) TaxID=1429867 RepID=A0A0G4P901_PENC3|nr:unnamed protein product [Penicillium camemberti]